MAGSGCEAPMQLPLHAGLCFYSSKRLQSPPGGQAVSGFGCLSYIVMPGGVMRVNLV